MKRYKLYMQNACFLFLVIEFVFLINAHYVCSLKHSKIVSVEDAIFCFLQSKNSKINIWISGDLDVNQTANTAIDSRWFRSHKPDCPELKWKNSGQCEKLQYLQILIRAKYQYKEMKQNISFCIKS